MTEAVMMAERIGTSIALGESHFREFKSGLEGRPDSKSPRELKDIARDISSTLVAFANADGGELLVGVEDNGEVTGLDISDEKLAHLSNCWKDGVHKSTPLSGVRHITSKINGRSVIYFSVMKSVSHVHLTADGRCLQRRDLESAPISAEEIQFTRQERQSQEYDRGFVDGASADALDLDLVRVLADQISSGMSPEKCLQYLDLADFGPGFLRVRRAALLLFAKDPKKWHPRLQIRILRVSGNEVETGVNYNIISDEYVEGNIVSIIEKAWMELRPHLVQTKLSGEARFESRVIYPELACREALINAIAHRDYSQEGRGIEIFVFDDRMEVTSPGGLLSSLSVADLQRLSGAHQSRNAFVARVLREMGFMREVGEGMRRIFELMHSNELAEPEIVTSPDRFVVGLRNRPLYRAEHLLWLESFSEYNLSRQEKAIVVLGYGGKDISPNDVFNGLGLIDTDDYRALITSLQTKRILHTVRTKATATGYARKNRMNIRDVPRYAVQIPQKRVEPALSSGEVGKFAGRQKKRPVTHAVEKRVDVRAVDAERYDVAARLFIGNLKGQVSEGELLRFLWDNGVNGDVTIPRSAVSYAFVQLDDASLVDPAIARLNGLELGGYPVVVRLAQPAAVKERKKRDAR